MILCKNLDRVLSDEDDVESVSREPSPSCEGDACESPCSTTSNSVGVGVSSAAPQQQLINSSSVATSILSQQQSMNNNYVMTTSKVTVATQTGHEAPDLSFCPDKMTVDRHCYECKVRYRDPKPQDLIMYLHAWKYRVGFYFQFFFIINIRK